MFKNNKIFSIVFLITFSCLAFAAEKKIFLPKPKFQSKISIEQALLNRRSIREYQDSPLTLKEISQLLWSAQGITSGWGGRTAPSAGALYPLEIYLIAGKIKNLKPGIYHYKPDGHLLILKKEGDFRKKICQAALGQEPIEFAPAVLVFTANYQRTQKKYGVRANLYVPIEVGCACENVYLQAESLGLGTVIIGAFVDEEIKEIIKIKEEPLSLMPVGKK